MTAALERLSAALAALHAADAQVAGVLAMAVRVLLGEDLDVAPGAACAALEAHARALDGLDRAADELATVAAAASAARRARLATTVANVRTLVRERSEAAAAT